MPWPRWAITTVIDTSARLADGLAGGVVPQDADGDLRKARASCPRSTSARCGARRSSIACSAPSTAAARRNRICSRDCDERRRRRSKRSDSGRRRSRCRRRVPRRSAIGSSIRSPIGWRALPDGPVTRDESPADVRAALGVPSSRCPAPATDAGRLLERRDATAVRPLAVQRRIRASSATSRRARRRSACSAISWRGAEPERRRVAAGAGRDRDRSADRAMDRRADRVSGRLRRAARQRRQHGELRLLPRRARAPRRRGTSASEGCRAADDDCCVYASTETHTWIQKAADLFGLGTDAIRWIATDDEQRMDVAALRRADRRRIVARRPSAVSRRRHGGLGQHRRRRSAAGDRRDLPRARRVVSRRRRVRRAGGAGAGRAGEPARR